MSAAKARAAARPRHDPPRNDRPPSARRRRGVLGCLGAALLWGLILVVALTAVAGAGAVWTVQRTLPQTTGTLEFAGLSRPVTVVRDRYGVPYISASTTQDLFFAQGFVTAQDRFFQMDMNRRIGAGRLAELFGRGPDDSVLKLDELTRTLGLYRAAQSEYDNADPQTRAILDAYAAGVNAYLHQHANSLPLEFTILGVSPDPWSPVDSLAYGRVMALSLDSSWQTKYARALVLAKAGPQATAALFPPYPRGNPTVFNAFGGAAPLEPTAPGHGPQASASSATALAALAAADGTTYARLSPAPLQAVATARTLLGNITDALGSNDWVVDGTMTTTGKPLLANDPHLGISEPAIWYQVALRGAGWNVMGFSLAGVPGVVIGHNAAIAWGVTNVGADNSDLYLEQLDPTGHPGQYLYAGQWQPLITRSETIHIRGETRPVTLTVSSTDHGPLLNGVVGDLKAFAPVALKWTAIQAGYALEGGFLQVDQATNWATFQQAVSNISISQNFVYADQAGHIGYQMSGLLPVRSSDNDLLPVPGNTSDHEWHGFVAPSQMPSLYDPPTHAIITANNQIVPDDYGTYVTANWDAGYRARRITDLILATPKLSVSDFERIQADVYAIPAAQLVPDFVMAGRAAGGDAATAAALLAKWDDQMTRSSGAAALYEVAVGTLAREIVEPVLTKKLYGTYRANISGSTMFLALINLAGNPVAPFFSATASTAPASTAARDAAFARALADAMRTLRASQGSDPAHWSWGALHQAHFAHPLASTFPVSLIFDIAPVARPGDSATVSVGGDGGFDADPASYAQRSISSMREIIDLANFDNSLWVIPAGQSGQPFSAHYSDLLPLWDQNHYERMPFTAGALDTTLRDILTLKPG